MVIALFRHGMTIENEKRAYIGWIDSPLSIKGEKNLLSKGILEQRYQQLFTSDLLRAKQTAAYFFPMQSYRELSYFREICFGDWEGRTYEQLKVDENYRSWLENPFEISPPNGEPYKHFVARIEKGWQELIKESSHLKKVAVITHGGVIRYLLSRYGCEEKGFWDFSIHHGEGVELIWSDYKSFRGRARCTLLREVAFTGKKTGY